MELVTVKKLDILQVSFDCYYARMEVLTLDDFRNCDWAAVISGAPNKECVAYHEALRSAAETARAAGKEKECLVLQLLGQVCSFGFEPRQIADPFPPLCIFGNTRTTVPQDIADPDLAVLGDLLPDIQDSEMRARIADLLWLRKRDHRSAEIAIDAYLSSALTLENGPAFQFSVQRIERALRLSVLLGNKKLFDTVIGAIEALIQRQTPKETLRCAYLMELLLEFREGDAVKKATLTKASAEEAATKKDFEAARGLPPENSAEMR